MEESQKPIEKARETLQKMRRIGRKTKPAIDKFIEKPTAKRAIRFFCYECMGCSKVGVRKCDSLDCTLWLFRNAGRKTPDEIAAWKKVFNKHRYRFGSGANKPGGKI